eukprot:2714790-Pleurochrysis_carterae.AAC.1
MASLSPPGGRGATASAPGSEMACGDYHMKYVIGYHNAQLADEQCRSAPTRWKIVILTTGSSTAKRKPATARA